MSIFGRVKRSRSESESSNRKFRPGLLLASLLAPAIVVLAVPYWYTASPESCTLCHQMQKYYDSWKESSHAKAADSCFSCHLKQNILSSTMFRVTFYREIYSSLTHQNAKPSGLIRPATKSCQRKGCHSLNRVESTSGDIIINHRVHITKADLECTRCHPDAAHPNVGSIGKITPPSEICKECHAARITECTFCHREITSSSGRFYH